VTPSPCKPAHPGGPQPQDRMASYRRYADLVRRQEEALIAGDLDGFQTLANQALELQHGLRASAPAPGSLAGFGSPAGPAPDPHELAEILRATLGAGERIESRLRALRAEAGGSVRRAAEGHRRARGYVPARDPDASQRLDLTL